ncbi:dTMP kinase [Legionella hackeliae]|uniref:Thymidylate kinase n=2 Tax=Legionella hackeliae TaxID=449 RepID=A0A0A8UVK9_LEGHA|nr:thymidylate kinase [Legionella hackeliae]CEK10809.1 Thymidylate kinase [Legionella hackeliae]STX47546.1 dTMP kinase [Legionella hackeliae]
MTKRGRFIVVEGLEGAGKSTAIKTIKQYLESFIPDIFLTREPGGTRVGEMIRTIIKEKVDGETLDPRAELLMLYAARVQLLEQVIEPALNRGSWVLADRFELSTFAYQGGGRHLDETVISTLSKFCLKGFKPDLIVFLDIEPEKGLNRVRQRGAADRMEQESLTFFTDVYNNYQRIIKTMNNVICIDASQPMDIVQKSIITQLKTFIAHNAIA